MEKYRNNIFAIAIKGMFSECKELKDMFDQEEYIEEKVDLATTEMYKRIQDGVQFGPNMREDILENIVLAELKIAKAEIEQYA